MLLTETENTTDEQVNAIFRMTKSPEELKKNPLPDKKYAGEIVEIWKESFS